MALVRDRDGKRLHVESNLMGESLVSRKFRDSLTVLPQKRLFPDVSVLKVGGQSICDRGASALPEIADEIAQSSKDHKMLVTTGGGTRSRHIYNIALELGMPTGIVAKFASSISEQNALLLATLLADRGGICIEQDQIVELSLYYKQETIPVMAAMPPYDYFAIPSNNRRIPIHRTDVGTIIVADLIGARQCIYVKDEKGLYTDDPKKNDRAEFIPEITAAELKKMDLDDLVIERPCLDILEDSEVIDKIQIINGLEKGNLTRALSGEHVGTIIRSS